MRTCDYSLFICCLCPIEAREEKRSKLMGHCRGSKRKRNSRLKIWYKTHTHTHIQFAHTARSASVVEVACRVGAWLLLQMEWIAWRACLSTNTKRRVSFGYTLRSLAIELKLIMHHANADLRERTFLTPRPFVRLSPPLSHCVFFLSIYLSSSNLYKSRRSGAARLKWAAELTDSSRTTSHFNTSTNIHIYQWYK